MKKPAVLFLSAALWAGLLAGCSSGSGADPAKLTGIVNTDGSTSMEQVVKGLAELFMYENDGVTINYTGSGSGAGIENVLNGSVDIGLASRALSAEEETRGAQAHLVALDGIALVVHPENPVDDLTTEQLVQIFTGEIQNWSALGGANAPIAVYGREGGSGTRSAFEEIAGVEDACVYVNEYSSAGDMIGSVAGNPNAIGYTSLSSVNDTVKALLVNGAACTEDALRDGSYAIQRPFLMVTKEGAALSPAAQAFLDYALSGRAAGIISMTGAAAP